MESYFSKIFDFENFFKKNYDYVIEKPPMSGDTLLPQILIDVKKHLSTRNIILNNDNCDGRTNSCQDEEIIINLIKKHLDASKYWIPQARHWFDIALKDTKYGWIPINIKSTTFDSSADNAGNLSLCVQAYTNYDIDLKKSYKSGYLVEKLVDKIKNNGFNKSNSKDYFFLVINKQDTSEIVINSVLGLKTLTPNLSNQPFQIVWRNNKESVFVDMKTSIDKYKILLTIYKTKSPTWQQIHKNLIDNWELD